MYRLQGVTEKTGVSVNVNGWECYSYRLLRATALAACPWHITPVYQEAPGELAIGRGPQL